MLELAIRGARIIDGTGAPARQGDIGIEGDAIAAVGEGVGRARREVDAGGMVVAPGFIDIHTHSDFTLLLDGRAASALHQGVSTQVNGNCGISAFPVGPEGPYMGPLESARQRRALAVDWDSARGYFAALGRGGLAINSAFFAGHGALRQAVMGQSAEAPTPGQMQAMKKLMARQMEEGALGLSTGLTYMPGSAARTEEIAELCAVTAPYGGIYATHMRNYTAAIMEALEEAIAIGRQAGVPVHVSHITPCPPATGSAPALVERLARAQREGQDLTAETEFYATGSTSLRSLLPPWALAGGTGALLGRLGQEELRQRMWRQIQEKGSELGGSTKTVLMQLGKWDLLWLGNCAVNRRDTGKTFAELGRQRGVHPFWAICDILVEEEGVVSFYGQDKAEADIDQLVQSPYCGVGSDGIALAADGVLAEEREHPRCYGGMPYLLRTLVAERRALGLEQAIAKITSFPARRMGLEGRGLLREGMRADVVLFEPGELRDQATIDQPCAYAEGVRWLWVNGQAAVAEGRLTGARPGRVLRRGGG
jgi:N-acyl-D-aspartate/D-glutamate deacylase